MSDSNNKKLKGLDKKKNSGLWQRAMDFTFQNANFTFDMSVEAFTVTVFIPLFIRLALLTRRLSATTKHFKTNRKLHKIIE